MQKYNISFKGQKIFIGIDVHKKNWDVAIAPEVGIVKRHTQKASAKELFDFLKKHYPDGDYLAVYESGFSGFAEKENIDDRSVVRIRKIVQKQLCGYKARVKHMLHCNGVEIPKRFENPRTHWSQAFIKWLKDDVALLSSTRNSLDLLIRQVETIRMTLLEATRIMRKLSQLERYKSKFDLLMTVPGIGFTVSMCILTEVYDVKRFHNDL